MRGRAGKATWLAWRSIRNPSLHLVTVKHFSTNRPFFPLGASSPSSATIKDSTLESVDAFEHRIFQGGTSGNETYNSREDAFFEKLDRLKNARQHWDVLNEDDDDSADAPHGIPEGLYLKFKQSAVDYDFYDDKGEGWVLSDKLMPYRADAEIYEASQEVDEEFYDLTKPPSYTNPKRGQFTVTTAEVLAKADFRNVRFLANFITDAGIIIKRSQTGISAKAQRKVAREIKTARAFGLMPFTTMGTKSFVFGRTMEGLDEDFEYESFDGPMDAGAINDERLGA